MVKFSIPSRPDAWEMNRNEKQNMMFYLNASSIFADVIDNLRPRLERVENGVERAQKLQDDAVKLLEDIRVTIPEKQRANLYNTSLDPKMQLVPKYTPAGKTVIVPQDDFRELVDAAKVKCGDCVIDSDDCHKCELFKLFTAVLPLNRYDGTFLCPYNLAEWQGGSD